jgi:hypothetical protein
VRSEQEESLRHNASVFISKSGKILKKILTFAERERERERDLVNDWRKRD